MSDLSEEEWDVAYKAKCKELKYLPYDESCIQLRNLIKTGLLRFTDIQTNPERFFRAHRLLIDPSQGPGFCVRLTVQYNLFAGTVLGLGNEQQVATLNEWQANGTLGYLCYPYIYIYILFLLLVPNSIVLLFRLFCVN